MGMFDYVVGVCPHCNSKFTVQSKILGESTMSDIGIGDNVGAVWDMDLELKEPCDRCKNMIVARISNGMILGFHKDSPTHLECGFGDVVVAGTKTREEVFEENVKGWSKG